MSMQPCDYKKYYLSLSFSKINEEEMFISRNVFERRFSKDDEELGLTNLSSSGNFFPISDIKQPFYKALNIRPTGVIKSYDIPISSQHAEYFAENLPNITDEFDFLFRKFCKEFTD